MHCSYSTIYKSQLDRHTERKHSEKPLPTCDICQKTFTNAVSLRRHVESHTAQRYSCTLCDVNFGKYKELVEHTRNQHPDEKPYKCSECDYASVERSKLVRHMKLHTSDRPFQCPHCSVAATTAFNLKRHIRTHTGEKPFQCDKCDARFAEGDGLVTHQRTHLTDKPYPCDKCPMSFTRHAERLKHLLRMHRASKEFICRLCQSTYPDLYQLRLHSKTHQVKKFKCDLCDYSSHCANYIEMHKLKKHEDSCDSQPVDVETDKVKKFKCDLCDFSSQYAKCLEIHKLKKHDVQPVDVKTDKVKKFKCDQCDYSSQYAKRVETHKLKIHEDSCDAQPEDCGGQFQS